MSNSDKPKKELFCDYCGTSMGFGVRHWRERLYCGSLECQREQREDERAEREQAHEQLDHDMGWR